MPDYTRAPLLGKNVSFVLQGISLDAGGQVVYDGGFGAQSLQGRCDRAVRRHRLTGDEVSALDANISHYVRYKRDWDLIMAGLKQRKRFAWENASQLADILETLFDGFDGAYVIFTTTRKIYEYWGVWNDYDWPVERVRNVETVSLQPIDMGTIANPRITSNPNAP